MKKLLYLLLIPFLNSCISTYPSGSPSGGGGYPSGGGGNNYPTQPTPAPTPRNRDKGLTITGIDLTPQYTIIYFSYVNRNRPYRDPRTGQVIDSGSEVVGIHQDAILYGSQGRRGFRLLRAENIPYYPQTQNMQPGSRKEFVLYFERLDPGIEDFDMFECNDSDQVVCWNFYGLRVRNPAPIYTPPSREQPPVEQPSTKTPQSVPTPDAPPVITKPNDGEPPAPTKPKTGKLEPKPTTDTPQPQAKTEPVNELALVRGVVRDAKTQQPVSAKIRYQLSSGNRDVDSLQSFQETGGYKIFLPNKQIYTYSVAAKGYLVTTDFLDLSKATNGQNISKDILLTPIEVGGKITLSHVFFATAESTLLVASYAELDKLVRMMKENPAMEIRLEGHTDIVGDKAANLQLSKDRVFAVRKYLIEKGISAQRVQSVGYGDTRPIITKGTDDERKVNRRVEFVVLKV